MRPQSTKLLNRTRVIVFALFVFSSFNCSKAPVIGSNFNVDAVASGSSVVPATNSTATGELIATYIRKDNTLTGTIKWSGLSGAPTSIHFHGPPLSGGNGVPHFTMVNVPKAATGSMTFSASFTESQEGYFGQNYYYFDIHTAAFPKGEIRGQILMP